MGSRGRGVEMREEELKVSRITHLRVPCMNRIL